MYSTEPDPDAILFENTPAEAPVGIAMVCGNALFFKIPISVLNDSILEAFESPVHVPKRVPRYMPKPVVRRRRSSLEVSMQRTDETFMSASLERYDPSSCMSHSTSFRPMMLKQLHHVKKISQAPRRKKATPVPLQLATLACSGFLDISAASDAFKPSTSTLRHARGKKDFEDIPEDDCLDQEAEIDDDF